MEKEEKNSRFVHINKSLDCQKVIMCDNKKIVYKLLSMKQIVIDKSNIK